MENQVDHENVYEENIYEQNFENDNDPNDDKWIVLFITMICFKFLLITCFKQIVDEIEISSCLLSKIYLTFIDIVITFSMMKFFFLYFTTTQIKLMMKVF
jgi:hypothetical protein